MIKSKYELPPSFPVKEKLTKKCEKEKNLLEKVNQLQEQ